MGDLPSRARGSKQFITLPHTQKRQKYVLERDTITFQITLKKSSRNLVATDNCKVSVLVMKSAVTVIGETQKNLAQRLTNVKYINLKQSTPFEVQSPFRHIVGMCHWVCRVT